VSFPNALLKVAELSYHHTPSTMKIELKKMPPNLPIILTHLKPNYRSQILHEIKELKEDRIRVLEEDGEVFQF
jgi:hypothetical protein